MKTRWKGDIPESGFESTESLSPSSRTLGRLEFKGRPGMSYCGMLVNPRTMRPYMVFYARHVTGTITVPTAGARIVVVGSGYLEESAGGEYGAPAEHFG